MAKNIKNSAKGKIIRLTSLDTLKELFVIALFSIAFLYIVIYTGTNPMQMMMNNSAQTRQHVQVPSDAQR
jgi:hypothetical protein